MLNSCHEHKLIIGQPTSVLASWLSWSSGKSSHSSDTSEVGSQLPTVTIPDIDFTWSQIIHLRGSQTSSKTHFFFFQRSETFSFRSLADDLRFLLNLQQIYLLQISGLYPLCIIYLCSFQRRLRNRQQETTYCGVYLVEMYLCLE